MNPTVSAFCSTQTTFWCRRRLLYPVYTIQPVVKPVDNRFDNRFDNRLYRVNGALRQLVLACEGELHWLVMSINVKKSACVRIGPRFSVTCSSIKTIDGSQISWRNNIRYLRIYLKTHRVFRFCYYHAKQSHSPPYLVKFAVWSPKK